MVAMFARCRRKALDVIVKQKTTDALLDLVKEDEIVLREQMFILHSCSG